jgi:hypothetical protein
MKGMQKKSSEVRLHRWDVSCQEAWAIQEKLREFWEGNDRLGNIRTVAGLDAAFVLTGSQGLQKKQNRWNRLREANQAIACVVLYRFPEMEEVARDFAIVPLEFPYVPGLLSFREIPALLAALKKLKALPDLLFCDGQGVCASATYGPGKPFRSAAGQAIDWMRKEHFDWHPWATERASWKLEGTDGRKSRCRADRGSGKDTRRGATGVCVAGEPGKFGDGDPADAASDGRVPDSPADTRRRPLCQ